MSFADKAKHAAEELVGKAKEAVGDATNNDDLKADGQTDQVEADVKQRGDKVQDAAGNVKDAFTK